MDNGTNKLRQFGEFRLDPEKQVLWHRDEPVDLALKEIELLSVLTENSGEVVTKTELLDKVWRDSFVEESNLSRHIYILRKTFKELGESGDLIQTVPRRGYRFTGDAREIEPGDLVVEKHTRTRTLIEFQDGTKSGFHSTRVFAYTVLVVVIAAASAFFAAQYLGPETSSKITSIAILPFKTLGAEPGTSHSGEGLADILTTRLSSLKDVKIRQASTGGQGADQDPVAAGKRLQVDAVLEGAIYYVGERVRVTARLVRVSDGSIVWTGEFDKLKREELQLQNDLALQIVPMLVMNLSTTERAALAKTYTENADAYELYLKGRYEWNKRSTPGMVEAQRLFRNAIAADPGFTLAYVGLADALLTHQPSADEAATVISKALELDPNLAEAHASRGFHLMFHQWNWQQSEESFRRSIELNPNYATAHHWYATLLAIKGETEAAKLEMQKAVELNPVSYNFLADLGKIYYFSGDYAEAEKYCLRALEIYPDFTFAHEYLHYIYLKTGQYEKAVVAIAKADEINGSFAHDQSKRYDPLGQYSDIFQRSGINGYLEQRYPGMPNASSPESFYPYAMKHALSGENDKALECLEKSTDARMFLSAFVKAEPVFERLRTEPRYQQILRKMGLA